MKASLDHLVVAGTDLSAVVAWWAARTGQQPTAGGAHTGRGTRNALVGLGSSSYLELIGPDHLQPDHEGDRPFGINDLEPHSIRLMTFALAVGDLDAAVSAVRDAGIDPGKITPMSRVRPDGVELSWRLAVPPSPKLGGTMPFLIEWGSDTPHPAADLPRGCELESIRLGHPEPELLQAALDAIGASFTVETERTPTLAAVITTPQGPLSL